MVIEPGKRNTISQLKQQQKISKAAYRVSVINRGAEIRPPFLASRLQAEHPLLSCSIGYALQGAYLIARTETTPLCRQVSNVNKILIPIPLQLRT